jgi:transcriptional regulator with XRE-family HTH domain
MFINKTNDGRNNFCGVNVAKFRKELKISQRELADHLQLIGLDVDKNAVQRIESGQRFVTDIELIYLAKVLSKRIEELYGIDTDEGEL